MNNFVATGNCELRKGLNETGKKMQDWMMAYLEALVLTEPWLYLREIRERLTNHLTFAAARSSRTLVNLQGTSNSRTLQKISDKSCSRKIHSCKFAMVACVQHLEGHSEHE